MIPDVYWFTRLHTKKKTSALNLFSHSPADAVVKLEGSVYSVPENGGQVQICAVVNTNNTNCVIGFSFEVVISLNAAAEGILFVYTYWVSLCSKSFCRGCGY